MRSQVENLIFVDLGSDLVAEADFEEHRINVRCVYEKASLSWVSHVFLVNAAIQRRLTDTPSMLRSSSRSEAVELGMRYAIARIRSQVEVAPRVEGKHLPLANPEGND